MDEHELFEKGLELYGKDWDLIAELVKSRNCSQVRSHAQKYFYRLEKEKCKEIPAEVMQSGRRLRERNSLKSNES